MHHGYLWWIDTCVITNYIFWGIFQEGCLAIHYFVYVDTEQIEYNWQVISLLVYVCEWYFVVYIERSPLLVLLMISCGMLLGLVNTLISRSKVIGYILFQKNLKNATKKLERQGDWYEIEEKWHFLWDFLWISEHDKYMLTVFPFYPSYPPFLPLSLWVGLRPPAILRFETNNSICNKNLVIFNHCV